MVDTLVSGLDVPVVEVTEVTLDVSLIAEGGRAMGDSVVDDDEDDDDVEVRVEAGVESGSFRSLGISL